MFKIETKLKKAAQRRAKAEGISLSDFYKSATKSFVEGQINVGLTVADDFALSVSEYKQGKSMGPFKSASSLKKSLEK